MDYHQERITKTARETSAIGEELARSIVAGAEDRRILCLYGELGSGKTTFTQGFARGLGIPSRLLSPTFIIVRRYGVPGNQLLYHIDLYRLGNEVATEELGLKEILTDPNVFVVIEWPEKLGSAQPQKRLDITFKTLEDGRHSIWIQKL